MKGEGPARVAGPLPCGRSVLDRRDDWDTNVGLRGYGACSGPQHLPRVQAVGRDEGPNASAVRAVRASHNRSTQDCVSWASPRTRCEGVAIRKCMHEDTCRSGRRGETVLWIRKEHDPAPDGSQKWLQILVNEPRHLVNQVATRQLGLDSQEQVEWLSPLTDDGYAEYRDRGFIDKLGVSLDKVPLQEFWPRGGPVWDGLARTGQGDLLLVEAKAHIPELVTNSTGATSESSLAQIRKSLDDTKQFLHSSAEADWTRCFYQYTNRLAHLYLLRELNDPDAHLLYIDFIGDREVGGPSTRSEWESAILLLGSFLGHRATGPWKHPLSPFILRAFIDVKDPQQDNG